MTKTTEGQQVVPENPWRRQQGWMFFVFRVSLAIGLGYAGVLFFFDLIKFRLSDWRSTIQIATLIVLGLTGTAALISGFAGLLMYPSVKKMDRALAAVKAGEFLARWSYADEGWKAHQQHLMNEAKESITGMFFPWSVMLLLVLFYAFRDPVAALITFIVALVILGGPQLFSVRRWLRARAAMRETPPTLETTISDTLLLLDGKAYHFEAFGSKLEQLTLEQDEEGGRARLLFAIANSAGEQSNTILLHVPVPDGEMQDAQRVLSILHKKYNITTLLFA